MKTKAKFKLVGSAPTIERLNDLVNNYFHAHIDFVGQTDGSFSLKHFGGSFIEGFRVVSKAGRFRLERKA